MAEDVTHDLGPRAEIDLPGRVAVPEHVPATELGGDAGGCGVCEPDAARRRW